MGGKWYSWLEEGLRIRDGRPVPVTSETDMTENYLAVIKPGSILHSWCGQCPSYGSGSKSIVRCVYTPEEAAEMGRPFATNCPKSR